MCGLFGFAGRSLSPEKRTTLLRSLCLFNSSRGEDSVGLAAIDTVAKRYKLWRDVVDPTIAIRDPKFEATARNHSANVWIGHTRFKTMGKVSINNAHPFVIGQTIGAHNGCIMNVAELGKRIKREYEVDSQYLIHLADRDDAIGEISGSACLSYVRFPNASDLTLMRWSNPLHVALIDDVSGVAWSSEQQHLINALAIAGIADYDLLPIRDGERVDFCIPQNREDCITFTPMDAPIEESWQWYSKRYGKGSISGKGKYSSAWNLEDYDEGDDRYYRSDSDLLPVKYQPEDGEEEAVEFDQCYVCGEWTSDTWIDSSDGFEYALCAGCIQQFGHAMCDDK